MAHGIGFDVSSELMEQFVEKCETRDEDPEKVVERLMADYTRGDDLVSKIEEIHEATVSGETSSRADDDAVSTEADAGEIRLLEDYDPADDERLSYEALEQLVETDDDVEIDPDDVDDDCVPQAVPVKQELIKAILRYQRSVVRKSHVIKVTNDLLDVGPGYRQRKYIEPVWDDLTVLDIDDVRVTFISDAKGALTWMDEQLMERKEEAEDDVYSLASELYHADVEVTDEALDDRLERLALDVTQLYHPE